MNTRRLALAALGGASAALAAAAAAPVGTLNAVAALRTRRVLQGQPYGAAARQRFDLFAPDDRRTPAPLVVFFYGGAWTRGRREDYRFVGEALAEQGLFAMLADYRLHPEVRYPDFVHDAAHAAAHALAQVAAWGADAGRVLVAGHSAGAYLAAMLALDDRWLRAAGTDRRRLAGWAGLAGPYDFLPIRDPEVQAAFGHPQVPPDSQPLWHAKASGHPCLLVAPQDAARVDPRRNSAALARALRAAGTPVTERYHARVSHETLVGAFAWPLRALAPVLDELTQFARGLRAVPAAA